MQKKEAGKIPASMQANLSLGSLSAKASRDKVEVESG